MLSIPLYYTLLGLCSIYAIRRGGEPERFGAAILLVASLLTLVAIGDRADRYRSVETGVLLIDIAAFTAFTILALRADRFWTIWVTALAGQGVLSHVGRWYLGPDMGRGAYVITMVIWSYFIVAVIAVGTWNHHRRKHQGQPVQRRPDGVWR
jgi:hypothetical protein